jgi:hypothetical protein
MAGASSNKPSAGTSTAAAGAAPASEGFAAARKVASVLLIGGIVCGVMTIVALAQGKLGAAGLRSLFAAAQIWLALVLMKRNPTARVVTLVWMGFVMVFMLFRILTLKAAMQAAAAAGAHGKPGMIIISSLACFGVAAWSYWTLTRPNVRAVFAAK